MVEINSLLLSNCTICPRYCKVDRYNGERGYCNSSAELVVARAALHMWEEPCISGYTGSGTVFFSGCALRCVYCQNHTISTGCTGKKITIERLADIFMELQEKCAMNINLVTPSHYVPQIIDAIIISRERGLVIPVVYNSSGYEKAETLKLLEGYVDIYLPDFKYNDSTIAQKYSKAPDYSVYAKDAIAEMVLQVGKAQFDENGIMKKGVIVRHLMLPGYLTDSKKIIKYLYQTYGNDIYISIMNQFTPMAHIPFPELRNKIREKDYDELVEYALNLGLENGFIQEGETATESFIPKFDNEGV